MGKEPFRFKEFVIYQDQCAMKVGTDGVLLGAWADIAGAKTILDVGSGTGLIALMCAQRNNEAKISAIEIDFAAAKQGASNVHSSPWKDRIALLSGDFRNQDYIRHFFDHIISNPPFFHDAQLSGDAARDIARHSHALSIRELAAGCIKVLKPNGKVSLILPADRLEEAEEEFAEHGLFLGRRTDVAGRIGKAPVRGLLEFSKTKTTTQHQLLTIEISRHCYTPEYIALTKDFYLKL